jgi:hypothetical protein
MAALNAKRSIKAQGSPGSNAASSCEEAVYLVQNSSLGTIQFKDDQCAARREVLAALLRAPARA